MLVHSLALVFLSLCCVATAYDMSLDEFGEANSSEWDPLENLDSEEEDQTTMSPYDLQPFWTLSDRQPDDNSFEIRQYGESTWVVASLPCMEAVKATGLSFLKLFLYINRYNYENLEYPLIYPVVTSFKSVNYPSSHDEDKLEQGQKFPLPRDCWKNYTVEMYLPTDYYSVVADPLDEEISVTNKSSATYAVLSFDGIGSIEKCQRYAFDLMSVLKSSDYEVMEDNTWKCAEYRAENGDLSSEIWVELDL